MRDFDAVLERLLTDPSFAAALAADPAAALAAYRLDPDEVQLLHTQVGGDPGGQRAVEMRANQSSLFGMLAPLAGLVGGLGVGDQSGSSATGHSPGVAPDPAPVPKTEGLGPAPLSADGLGPGPRAAEDMGSAVQPDGRGAAGPTAAGDGPGQPGHTDLFGAAGESDGLGPAPGATEGFGAAPPADPALPQGYHTRVDADGDGRWDRHSLRGRADGGVDIPVDANHDGRVDFVGHDDDADGLVDSADYDKNHDGSFEKRMYDDDGDGWMDRIVRVP